MEQDLRHLGPWEGGAQGHEQGLWWTGGVEQVLWGAVRHLGGSKDPETPRSLGGGEVCGWSRCGRDTWSLGGHAPSPEVPGSPQYQRET